MSLPLTAPLSALSSTNPSKLTADDVKQQKQADDYREVVANAYSYVEGQKSAQSFAALTPEDLMDRFIERISGKDTQSRPNVLNRIAKIKNELTATIAKIKALPESAFRRQNDATDVNTSPTPVDTTDNIYSSAVTSQSA
jgi:hypothetical protein